ncbi:MAG: heme-binding beta-barrel domain-containing protein [Deltaproteobacteria bacterium]|nr:heme-binding beta-barrel domain-containing protein [Deltaproteobacteria bacterium]
MSGGGIDYGPLAALIGTWQGDKGTDVSPEPDGTEENPYYETIVFEAAGDVTNAEAQTLAIVRYHQVVTRKSNNEVFHDQIGYWTWDPATKTIAQSVNIPRVVAVLAGGSFEGDASGSEVVLDVYAKKGDPDWGIIESPFMRDSASTVAFEHRVEVSGDCMSYSETTSLDIYGRKFDHTDTNELTRTSG